MQLIHWKNVLATAVCAATYSQLSLAQLSSPTILEVEVRDWVSYSHSVTDYTKLATDPNVPSRDIARNFGTFTGLGDIVAVNGKPAKGNLVTTGEGINFTPTPTPGQAIADVNRQNVVHSVYEILQADGTPIGTIMVAGLAGGANPPPPGAPLSPTRDNLTIVGGTGAFLGARGQAAAVQTTFRGTSVVEDPSNRRIHPGAGSRRDILNIIPMSRPEILTTSGGPAVFHADFSPVTAAKPAKAGEVLITMATGLGPTRPGVNPGQPFPSYPANPLQLINSPVDATVNGQAAAVINAVGWPGLVDTYRVDVRVPDGIAAGLAAIQFSAAWIIGPSVSIPIQ